MKILSCITSLKELELLKIAGADELYFGLNHNIIPNYSEYGNIRTLKEAKEIIEKAHSLNLRVYLAVNGTNFYPANYDKIIENINKIIDYGIDGLIVSSLGILNKLEKTKIPIHISSTNPVFNTEYLKFLTENFKISRVILTNQLSANESKGIINYCKKHHIETEVFFYKFFGCPYINGFCYLHEGSFLKFQNVKEGQQCNLTPNLYKIKPYKVNHMETRIINQIKSRMSCSNFPRVLNPASFFDFHLMGVEVTKYGSRTDQTPEKIKKVKFIKYTLKYLQQLIKKFKNKEKAKKIFSLTINNFYE